MTKNCLLILFTFLVLSGLGQNSQQNPSKKPIAKNIVLLIGDGMGTSQVFAGIVANKGRLNLMEFKDIGFSKTQSATEFITDSGAGGTAISTGHKTFGQAIGVDKDTIPRTTILEYAEKNNKATGLIATSQITHATPASFIAHQPNRYLYEEIASDFLNSGIDVFIGGGLNHFNKRKDSIDLTASLANMGYQLVYSQEALNNIHKGKVAGLLYPDAPPRVSEGRNDMLVTSVNCALKVLAKEENGFFLMIEGSQIDWGAHANDTEFITEELLDFDNAIGCVLEFAKKEGNTLVIVTADHETGGMSIQEGQVETGEIKAEYTTTHHTGVMVPVFSYGPGSENFKGIYENTDLFYKMMMLFGFPVNQN